MNSGDSDSLLDLCISGDRKQIAAVPLRYRLIALGFVRKLSLEELNKKLLENNCEILYSRSLWEATLIYAFRSGLSYTSWKELLSECKSVKNSIAEGSSMLSSASLSLEDIRSYIFDNSILDNAVAYTKHKTQMLSEQISEIRNDIQAFRLFLLSNVSSFSTVREKTRYYFCKYLYYYLSYRMEEILNAIERNEPIRKVWDTLSVFRVRTALDRKKHSSEEAREKIMSSPLSFGEIYDAFEHFYFDYTSQDWMEVLLVYYGNITTLTGVQKKQLAKEARKRNRDIRNLSDDDVIDWLRDEMERKEREADALYSVDNKKAVYQRGRSGENFLRKVLRGELDLDRITFIAFLLFFGKETHNRLPAGHRLTRDRLNDILQESGFPVLDTERPSDLFFTDFISTDDPMSLLMEEAETMAFSEENFYLYKTYISSESNEKKWDEITN
ncbi:MAG: hypothetical protein IKP86_03850 [Anaerolineaceae bacterium]|nr:hypothetical protein [Anaerolineaceae bacterium]